MRQPGITIVQRGRADRFGMQKLYLRYAWNYHTNYIALPWKVLPKDWDARAQSLKPKAILGGEGAVVVNTDLRNKLNKAFLIATELTAANIAPCLPCIMSHQINQKPSLWQSYPSKSPLQARYSKSIFRLSRMN